MNRKDILIRERRKILDSLEWDSPKNIVNLKILDDELDEIEMEELINSQYWQDSQQLLRESKKLLDECRQSIEDYRRKLSEST